MTALVAPAFIHAHEVWSTTEEFSFGYLVVPVSLGLLWLRRVDIRKSLGPGATSGLIVVVAALSVYLFAERIEIHALAGLAVPLLLVSSVVYLWGWAAGRAVC